MWEAALQKLLILSTKKIGYKVLKHLTSWLFNELIKLRWFEQLGPGMGSSELSTLLVI